MLKQQSLIDTCGWVPDPEFAIFPQGARAKDAIFSPEHPTDPSLTPHKRYLFKRSKRSYPDQFWGEVVAYRIGCAIGIEVPPAFAAWNSDAGTCAALIEWFYTDSEEISILAGDLLTITQPDFDRKTGSSHNLRDASRLLRTLLPTGVDRLGVAWRQWWTNTLFFDALIGNTDRHQDNWALLLQPTDNRRSLAQRIRIGPCFDNGTSLGHERFTQRTAQWQPVDYERYLNKGTHHIQWTLDTPCKGHFDLLQQALQTWPEARTHCCQMAQSLSLPMLQSVLDDLSGIECPVPFTRERYTFILKLLRLRIDRLQRLLCP